MKRLLHILILLILFGTCGVFGQGMRDQTYSIKNKRAIQQFEGGTVYYDQWRRTLKREMAEKAITEISGALKTDSTFIEAWALLGDVYGETRQWKESCNAYAHVEKINPDFYPDIYLSYGKVEMADGNYSGAKKHLEKFLSYEKQRPPDIAVAKRLLASCAFAENAIKNPVPFEPKNMGPNINSKDDEYSPTITVDGQKFIFTVRLYSSVYDEFGKLVRERVQEDFYESIWKDGQWSPRRNVGPPINTDGNEGAQCISSDGQYLFYTACERRDGLGRCDIYGAKREGNHWGKPVNMGPTINTPFWESHPCFASDGKTLYYTSTMDGGTGKGTSDIWYCTLDDNGKWTGPYNMGPTINTEMNEMFPFLHPDGKTMYFVSDGHPGMGGRDIFITRKDANGEWSTPVNLGYPINTFADETSLIVNPEGTIAYFASERPNEGEGRIDLYWFPLYEGVRPEKVTYVKGKVFNATSKDPLEAKFILIDLDKGDQVVESWSQKDDGEFLVSLPTDGNYALNVSKDGFLFYSENFSLKDKPSDKPFQMNVPLQPIVVGGTVVLKNVFFESGLYSLREESKAELMRLVDLLQKQPTMTIEIGGHTDNVGQKSDNQLLSENRAKAVEDFLVQNGIDRQRLSHKGYGDTKPIATNNTEEGRAQNRRTEFTVITK
ncbi:MAG: PD40 domain-containing protein [Flavobacteriales bacterium]|nr:PD40 domain-containing protein [Flavobacteriales bacterium]MCB9447928.1 PD40 domain-containing protein [Flavobacteriales bacterium]